MDWFLDSAHSDRVHQVRREVLLFLRRHGTSDSDFGAAELAVAELLGNAEPASASTVTAA